MSDMRVKLILDLMDRITAPAKSVGNSYVATMKRMQESTKKVRETLNSTGTAITKFGANMTSFKPLAGLTAFGVVAIKTASSIEDMMSSLETATGSKDMGKKVFDDISKFAKTTPYSLGEVTNSWIKLKNLGLDPSNESLTSFGNTASAMNKPLDQMIEAVADAATGEFERLKEFGIKASKEGNKVTFTFQGIKTTIKNDAASIQAYLKSIGDVNFGGAMEKKMTNFSGVWSNFMDTITASTNMAGLQIMESLKVKEVLNNVANVVQRLTDKFMALPAPIRDTLVVGAFLATLIGPIIMGLGSMVIGIGGLVWSFGLVAPALLVAGGAIKAFGLALLTTPIGWITLGLAALAGAAYLIYSNWGSIAAWFTKLWDDITWAFDQGVQKALDFLKPLLDAITTIKNIGGRIGSGITSVWGGAAGQAGAVPSGAALPLTGPRAQNVDMGGTLNIKIDASGQPKVMEAKPNDGRMGYSVDTGLLMGSPG